MYGLGSNFPFLLILFLDSDLIFRACFCFILFYSGSHDFFFLVDIGPFLFWFCLCYSDSLALESCCDSLGVGCLFSFDLSHGY